MSQTRSRTRNLNPSPRSPSCCLMTKRSRCRCYHCCRYYRCCQTNSTNRSRCRCWPRRRQGRPQDLHRSSASFSAARQPRHRPPRHQRACPEQFALLGRAAAAPLPQHRRARPLRPSLRPIARQIRSLDRVRGNIWIFWTSSSRNTPDLELLTLSRGRTGRSKKPHSLTIFQALVLLPQSLDRDIDRGNFGNLS